ncbi:MAG TPA: hypothetical protein V6C72_02400, partial [Chroococcales cyanobacterium]
MVSGEFSHEIDTRSAELFNLMSKPFERDFEALGYSARLYLPVNPDARILSDNLTNTSAGTLRNSKLDSTKDWVVEVGYLPAQDKLGFTRLELPLKSPSNDESLILQRLSGDYFLPMYGKAGTEQAYTNPSADETVTHALPSLFVTTLLARAGYGLPELFTSPDDLRLHMAELTDHATKWATQETIIIPEDAVSQTTLTRISSRRPRGSHQEIDASLSWVSELISPDKTKRKQLTIIFTGSDYFVEPPTISAQELRQTDAILAQPGTEVYEVIKQTNIVPTPD